MRIGSIETSALYDTLRQDIKDAINAGESADEIIDLVDSSYLSGYTNGMADMIEKLAERNRK